MTSALLIVKGSKVRIIRICTEKTNESNVEVLFQGWLEKAERGALLGSEELNLADLFHPNTFLNAVRQKTARDLRVSMDELKFVCSWRGAISSAKANVKVSAKGLSAF